MTRETKIGLLVGLAFIIVIGILLSDHFRGTQEPPPATLDRAGAVVRQTVNAPGVNQPNAPVTLAPDQINPRGAVQTSRDLEPQSSPVVLKPTAMPPASGLPENDPLVQIAKANGQDLVPANSGGVGQPIAIVAQRTYAAQPGDTVSRMAARFLGANTHQNRQAIIQANPSLTADPNKVIVGQSYVIPGGAAVAAGSGAAVTATSDTPYVYTVKMGDTLWGIATGQLGKASAIETIKQLNRDALHGGNNLRPGMKLRLPSAPLAIAD